MDKKDMSTKKDEFLHKAGDKIERLGEKLKEKGAGKLGGKIYEAGNKIEHSGDK